MENDHENALFAVEVSVLMSNNIFLSHIAPTQKNAGVSQETNNSSSLLASWLILSRGFDLRMKFNYRNMCDSPLKHSISRITHTSL